MRTVTLIPHLEKAAQELAVTDRPQPASLDARREDYQASDDRPSDDRPSERAASHLVDTVHVGVAEG